MVRVMAVSVITDVHVKGVWEHRMLRCNPAESQTPGVNTKVASPDVFGGFTSIRAKCETKRVTATRHVFPFLHSARGGGRERKPGGFGVFSSPPTKPTDNV